VIWIILAVLGVPLWLCAVGILTVVVRNHKLRVRGGDVFVRRRPAGRKRWGRGHGVWVHDVFAFRGSPAGWSESLVWVSTASTRPVADSREAKQLRRLGEDPFICVMTGVDGTTFEVAARRERSLDLLGPLLADAASKPRPARTQNP
jgi:hypothetical protein